MWGVYMKKNPFFYYLEFVQVLILACIITACGTGSGNAGRDESERSPAESTSIAPRKSVPAPAALPDGTRPSGTRQSGSVSVPGTPPAHTTTAGEGQSAPETSPNAEKHVNKGVYLGKKNIGGMSETKLEALLKETAVKTDVSVKNARMDDNTWEIVKGRIGEKLDIEKTKKAALNAPPGAKVKYSRTSIQPKVTSAMLRKKVRLLGKSTTPILDKSNSRVNNIHLVSEKIDTKIIMPGEEFSFNETAGKRSKKLGYKKATVIVKTPKGPKHKKAPGGGVCQVSTTLYNAALKSGMKITERHEHSDDVHYVPDGKDATVTYNGADLKFVNSRKYPVMIRIYIGKKTVTVRLYEKTA